MRVVIFLRSFQFNSAVSDIPRSFFDAIQRHPV